MKKKDLKSHPWSIQAKPYDSVLWKKLPLNFKQVLLNYKWKDQSRQINFWYDVWFGESPLIEFASGNPPITLYLKDMMLKDGS